MRTWDKGVRKKMGDILLANAENPQQQQQQQQW